MESTRKSNLLELKDINKLLKQGFSHYSGVINKDGKIVTNFHVIKEAFKPTTFNQN